MGSFLKQTCCIAFLFGNISVACADTLLLSSERQESSNLSITDHGVHGELFTIAEEDMLQVIQKRLLQLKESGALDAFQRDFTNQAKQRMLEPKAISHITPTTHTRVFYVDPTLTIEGDIVIPEGLKNAGHILAKKGDRVNPLHTLKPQKGLFFMDGDNEQHQHFAIQHVHQYDIVLVTGKPLELEKKLNLPIFFDQGGIITKRYGINHVPAKMEIEGEKLKFTEFKL